MKDPHINLKFFKFIWGSFCLNKGAKKEKRREEKSKVKEGKSATTIGHSNVDILELVNQP
ncbi:MAG TPA: hypothetical protein DD730_12285 [Desulfosporosinus sp.]|jgi:hypothetical protein|nr:hypothetical protein [Desulfosporosinus sp.]